MKLKSSHLAIIWGSLWMLGGFSLLRKGVSLFFLSQEGFRPLVKLLPFSMEISTLVFAMIALFLGMLKGRKILAKTAQKMLARFKSLESDKISMAQAFEKKNLILIGSMVALGLVLNVLSIPNDIRGFIDTAVGAGLIQGALTFFRAPSPIKA